MSKRSKVNVWGGWLTNDEGWRRLQVFKAKNNNTPKKTANQRKKQKPSNKPINNNTEQQTNTSTNNQTTSYTPVATFQQLNLQVENIDQNDGEAFGDKMGNKDEDTVRIISQNIGCLQENTRNNKSKQIINQVCNWGADVWLLQEVGIC
jgi:hypothetical protein